MAFDLTKITSYEALIAAQPSQKVNLWSAGIRMDARDMNVLKPLIGKEGSGKPFIEKRDLKAGGAQSVTFTTTAPVRMAGTMGEAELKSHTGELEFGDFSVTVDMRRFAISHNQMLRYLRFNKGMKPEELSYKLCGELWGRMEQDDLQIVLRNKAYFSANQDNVFYIGGGTGLADLTLADTLDTAVLEQSANALEGQGCMALGTEEDRAGYDVPNYTLFTPKKFSQPIWDYSKFREALLHAESRGATNPHWTGKMPQWKGNTILNHGIVIDTANGRQGSPLAPIAFVGKPIPSNVATTITGGGAYNVAGTNTDVVLYDYFAYFFGFTWKTYGAESALTDTATHYAIIYNVSGADRGKYEIVSYVAAGNNSNELTVIREVDETTLVQKTRLTVASRYSVVHPTGSWIIPCTAWGVPIGMALHLGAEAEFMAQGAVDAQRISHSDDFESVNATGIQGIRGYAPYEDTLNRLPNYLLIVGALNYPGLNLLDLTTAAIS